MAGSRGACRNGSIVRCASADPAGRTATGLRRLVEAMPKAELHLHLDGSLRIDTALELARTAGRRRAADVRRDVRRRSSPPPRTASQAELLRAFDLPIACSRTPTRSSGSTARAGRGRRPPTASATSRSAGRRRSTPSAAWRSPRASPPSAAAPPRRPTRTRRASARLICTAIRVARPGAATVELAETAARFRDVGLVGWDLAGPEERYPDPLRFARAFDVGPRRRPADHLHAGEWGGAAQVRRALALDPERIAHGPSRSTTRRSWPS